MVVAVALLLWLIAATFVTIDLITAGSSPVRLSYLVCFGAGFFAVVAVQWKWSTSSSWLKAPQVSIAASFGRTMRIGSLSSRSRSARSGVGRQGRLDPQCNIAQLSSTRHNTFQLSTARHSTAPPVARQLARAMRSGSSSLLPKSVRSGFRRQGRLDPQCNSARYSSTRHDTFDFSTARRSTAQPVARYITIVTLSIAIARRPS